MKPIEDALKEMRDTAKEIADADIPGFGNRCTNWADAFETAMREPEAWKSIDREGIEDATVYEDTMQDWVRFGRRIVPLFAFPPNAAMEVERLKELLLRANRALQHTTEFDPVRMDPECDSDHLIIEIKAALNTEVQG